ncbi:hypothetical protein [uncultured Methylobacterium sp.]|uniref:hypothetical protein n=1 Tax=uncultured Methylobacterium sp. TaxID=157278 RepID=UPI00259366CA|nr:hypothetical protein [uncultured Methylobacterium sp.]
MTAHSILAAAAVLAGFIASADAQEGRTFDAWGHTFEVPGYRAASRTVAAEPDACRTVAPKRTCVLGKVGTVVESEVLTPGTTSKVINVWGARIEVPAR